MANQRGIFYFIYALVLVSSLLLKCQCEERKVHIVYLGELPRGGDGDHDGTTASSLASTQHHSILSNVLESASLARELLVHRYHRSFNGFAARLTTDEAEKISRMEGVVSVIPNQVYHIQTTRSWDFMRFNVNSLINHNPSLSHHGDVIVGMIDSGIWPEHESFDDEGISPPPARWKGSCEAANFCNNKIIGARYYHINATSPRDHVGHGTHTSATVAGREVANASYSGLGRGTARGGFPNAKIAMYNVIGYNVIGGAEAYSDDILKAFDDAIADGVDIISISMGLNGPSPSRYFHDAIAIGAFHAMKNGILTSAAAANNGPERVTLQNFAPWTLTVAASTIDRKFNTRVMLGNGRFVNVISVNNFKGIAYPLAYGGDIANYTGGSDPHLARTCSPGSMDVNKPAGKIVLCYPGDQYITVWLPPLQELDAQGVIIVVSTLSEAMNYPLPATTITEEDSHIILDYIRSTENPFATILVADEHKDLTAPTVASFSSRGPNAISPDILKPDITAPGVDILAAWPPNTGPSGFEEDKQSVNYNIISGTSMACPHATAAAAYVKAVHPDWSPAAIKSALMTTSFRMDPRKHAEREFAYGAGHLNPVAAVDPGLVFDANETDYTHFLCKQGYNSTTLKVVTGDNSTCNNVADGRGWDLNYPSFSLSLLDDQEINATFIRTVTNVGKPSTYKASIQGADASTKFKVKVEPSVLNFSSVGEKKSFTVEVTGPKISQQLIMSVHVVWTDGVHEVRTPLVVYNYIPGAPYS
ncbi:OLC1v1029508C1 [Oldenlandia corymbosa var. corymbosa]|uniref:OLC1v1029508C1 n=1 Tax=Oldenlandia corymbosa var. corymbosa TaxID=529605 RepID=A0AAV1CF10_OLDCO|nr:OLC1v1029508C1 [Oldenlandia corymbosa var. corymbosa]